MADEIDDTPGVCTYHGPGIFSKVRARDGARIYFAQVSFRGKRYAEKAGTTEKQAIKLLGIRQTEVDNKKYTPPRLRRAAEKAEESKREDLLFETARAKFLEDCLADYADTNDVKSLLGILGRAFDARYLDEITRADLSRYVEQRRKHEGPFKGWKRRTGLRGPHRELVMLSQVFRHMQDLGHEVANPCLRPAGEGRSKRTKATTYRPERKAVIPSLEALGAILNAKAVRQAEQHRALFLLAYYTGGRPESDLLRLRHGDVTLVEDNVRAINGKRVLGEVRFDDAKTPAGNRTVPLHPEAAKALAAIMAKEPADAGERRTWAALSIFRTAKKDGTPKPWDRDSYRKAWATMLEAALPKHPEAAGMIVRDLRKAFRTALTNARVPEPTIRRLMGHALNVSESYHQLGADVAREAIMSIPVPPAASAEQVADRVAVIPVSAVNA